MYLPTAILTFTLLYNMIYHDQEENDSNLEQVEYDRRYLQESDIPDESNESDIEVS